MEAEVKALEHQRFQAMLDSDVAALDEIISDKLAYLHSSGGRDTKDSYLAQIRDGVITYNRVAMPDPEIIVASDTAVVFGRMNADVVREGRDLALDYDYLAVWAREDGRWRFLVFQPRPATD